MDALVLSIATKLVPGAGEFVQYWVQKKLPIYELGEPFPGFEQVTAKVCMMYISRETMENLQDDEAVDLMAASRPYKDGYVVPMCLSPALRGILKVIYQDECQRDTMQKIQAEGERVRSEYLRKHTERISRPWWRKIADIITGNDL
jgi:hypothetical protein